MDIQKEIKRIAEEAGYVAQEVSELSMVDDAHAAGFKGFVEPVSLGAKLPENLISLFESSIAPKGEGATLLFYLSQAEKWDVKLEAYVEHYLTYHVTPRTSELMENIERVSSLGKRLVNARDILIKEHASLYEKARTIGVDCSRFLSTKSFEEELRSNSISLRVQIPNKYAQLEALRKAVSEFCDEQLKDTDQLFETLTNLGV